MMEIKNAIDYFEDAIRESDEIISECSSALQAELAAQKVHFVVALAALREQEQREQGCEFCTTEGSDIPLPTDIGNTWISGNKLENAYGSCEINLCPLCGCKLGGAEK